MPERLMREPPRDGVPGDAFRAAPPTPVVALNDAALQHRPIRLEALADGYETELIETAEHGQIGRGEDSVEHVEVFRMAGVGTSILGRPRPLPGHQRAHPNYTVNCEEPVL